jgi:hypothetical protein
MFGRTRVPLLAALTVVTLAVAAAPAQAQSGGIKGGFLYSTLNFDQTADVWESNNGWTIGMFFGSDRDKTVGFLGEINFQERGGRSAIGDIDLYYISIPVLLRVGAGDAVNVYAIAGPSFDIKIGESEPETDDGVELVQDWEGIDIGITFGGGLEFGGHFLVEARVNWGLRNIAATALLFEGEKLTNRSFALQAGIRFK